MVFRSLSVGQNLVSWSRVFTFWLLVRVTTCVSSHVEKLKPFRRSYLLQQWSADCWDRGHAASWRESAVCTGWLSEGLLITAVSVDRTPEFPPTYLRRFTSDSDVVELVDYQAFSLWRVHPQWLWEIDQFTVASCLDYLFQTACDESLLNLRLGRGRWEVGERQVGSDSPAVCTTLSPSHPQSLLGSRGCGIQEVLPGMSAMGNSTSWKAATGAKGIKEVCLPGSCHAWYKQFDMSLPPLGEGWMLSLKGFRGLFHCSFPSYQEIAFLMVN